MNFWSMLVPALLEVAAQVVGVEGGSEVDGERTCVNSLWGSSYRTTTSSTLPASDSFECDRVH